MFPGGVSTGSSSALALVAGLGRTHCFSAGPNGVSHHRRSHIAGNIYDIVDENGIRVHRYGAHIFHTSSKTVWRYLSEFTDWRAYEHKVVASVSGRLVPLPCNLNTSMPSLEKRTPPRSARTLIEEFSFGAESRSFG